MTVLKMTKGLDKQVEKKKRKEETTNSFSNQC